ncbi:helix-turn-helix domain-containing protein [Paenibacillus sp. HB172176]|uniref:helix-turn-helix domain-containing protein n=1 Tax=Paenibacillus sp. HB172176 TaxID=2493690 RepID=UPI001439032A|nr:helix-turn-helix domain-containing protein [Paenibacillus sp. HB172176]
MNKWIDFIKVNKLFVKILLSFLSLLIPVALLGTIAYVNSVNELKKEYTEKLELHLASSSKSVENYWKMIYEAGIHFYGEPDVIRLLDPSSWHNEEDRANLHLLFDSIERARFHVNQFTDDVFVYVDDTYVLTGSGVNDFYAFFDKINTFGSRNAEDWLELLQSEDSVDILKPDQVSTAFRTSEVITFLVRNPSGEHKAVLAATVPVSKVLDALQPVIDQGASGVVVLDDQGNLVLSTNERFNHLKTWTLPDDNQQDDNDAKKSKEVTIEHQRYIVSRTVTDTFHWTYYAVTPIKSFENQAGGILHLIVGISLVLIIVGITCAFIFSLNIYNPIRKIVEIYLEEDRRSRKEESPGKLPKDLNAIGEGIQQLITYRDRYHDEWQMMARDYVDHALHQIIGGSDITRKQQEDMVRMLETHLDFRKPLYLCYVVAFEFMERFFEEIQDIERIVIETKIKNLIRGYLSHYANIYVLESREHLYYCIVNVDSGEEAERFNQAMEHFMRTFEYDKKYYRMKIGAGLPYEGLDGITKSYRGAMTALQLIRTDDPEQMAHAAGSNEKQEVAYTYADENKLLKALRFGDKEEADATIREIVQRPELSYIVRNEFIGNMYETAARFALERGVELDRMTGERDLLHSGNSSWQSAEIALDERMKLLANSLHAIIDLTAPEKKTHKSKELAQTIKQYVEEQYMTDLHLESIAEQMKVSVKYVSRVFKEHYHTNLSDYISELRVQAAKELLVSSKLTVNDISERVGFYNRTTFLRTFRKFEGLSPNQYRQKQAAQSHEEEQS